MKKLVLIPVLFLLICSLSAQQKFVIPELSDSTRYVRMVFQANGFILNSINYAKSVGKTVEDIAAFTGEQYKYTWNRDNGFQGFVRGTLYNWLCFVPGSSLEILDQSDSMIKFKTTAINQNLQKNSPLFNVTYEEYLTFLRILFEKIGDYLSSDYSQELAGEGMVVTIKKK